MLPSFAFAQTLPPFADNHQLWDASPDIQSLQQFLNTQGFIVAESGAGSPGQETETFGTHTYQALVQFQAAHNLPSTGYFGPLTRAVINALATSSEASSAGAAAVSTNTIPPTTATTSGQYIPSVTPLPGYAPGNGYTPGFGGGSPAPTCSISVSKASISIGSSTLLTWSSTYGSSASISNIGSVQTSGSQSVTPSVSTTYTLTIAGGGGSTSCNTNVTAVDTTPPSVSLTAPSSNTTVSGSAVNLAANASDNVGVVGVQFKVDGSNVGAEQTSAPYSIAWDSTTVAYGTHTITAVARDAAGNYATSSAVSVTVNNSSLSSAGSADLYWVGGSGNWSDGHHWAITSGGVGQYNPPTTSNVVHFDSNSSPIAYTVTVDSAANSATTTVANPASGSPTFAGSAAWTNSGGLTLVSGMGWAYTGAMTFTATSLGKTITTAGVALANNITFNGTAGGWTLQDNLTNSTSSTITVSAGIFNTNAQTVTTGLFVSTSGTRTLTLTNSTLNITGTSGSVWNISTTGSLTFTSTGSTININGNGNRTVAFGVLTYATMNITGSGGITTSNNAATFTNFNRTGSADTTDNIILPGITVTGTLTLAGNSQTNRLLVGSSNAGSNRTVTAANVALSNVDFSNITAAGAAAPFTGTSLGDASGNSNISFTSSATRYWVGGTGNYSDVTHWSVSSGGAGGATMPLPQDTALFDANSFGASGQVVTLDEPRIGAQDWSAVTNAPTLALTANYQILGSVDFPTGDGAMLMTGSTAITGTISNQTGTLDVNLHVAAISGSNFISGLGFPGSINVNAPGGTVRLQSDFMSDQGFAINSGTFNANIFDLQYKSFTSTGSATRVLQMGSGRWVATSNGTLWNVTSTGMTLVPNGTNFDN